MEIPGIMTRIARFILSLAIAVSLSACVWIHSSAISEASGNGSPVTATYSDYGILHLSKPADLAAGANADLTKQCQSGQLTDVQTEMSMRDWFFIVQYYTIAANATCK